MRQLTTTIPAILLAFTTIGCVAEGPVTIEPSLEEREISQANDVQSWLQKNDGPPMHYTVGEELPESTSAKTLIECPAKINVPTSAEGWNGLPYKRSVLNHDSYCYPGTCLLSCQTIGSPTPLEVYEYVSFDYCIPAISPTGTKYFDCGND